MAMTPTVKKNAFLWLAMTSLGFVTTAYAAEPLSVSAKARQLAKEALIADTHIDVPYRIEDKYADVTKATKDGDFDYPRAVEGGLDAAFMSVYIPAEYEKKAAVSPWLID